MTLYLIRHAEYQPGKEASHGDDMAAGLSPFGRSQAKAVARFLNRKNIGAVYSSELLRAKETAGIIATQCGATVNIDARLNEFVATLHERDHTKIKEIKRRARENRDFAASDGESLNHMVARFESALADIARSGNESAVVVSHEMIMQYSLMKIFSLPRRPNLRMASISMLEYKDGGWRLAGLNRTAWSLPVFWGKLKRRLSV